MKLGALGVDPTVVKGCREKARSKHCRLERESTVAGKKARTNDPLNWA